MNRHALIGLENGTKLQIDIDQLFRLIDMGLDMTPAPVNNPRSHAQRGNEDKELEFFEQCINEDKELLSGFCSYIKTNKDELKEYTLFGIGG